MCAGTVQQWIGRVQNDLVLSGYASNLDTEQQVNGTL